MHPPFCNQYFPARFRIEREHDLDSICGTIAALLSIHINAEKETTLILSTGSSPVGVYERLIKYHAEEGLSFKGVRAMNLDEYVGLGEGDAQSYAQFMRDKLFDHIDIEPRRTDIPNGKASDLERECLRYDSALDVEQVDIALIGLGRNGHIAFNEPGDSFISDTHIVELDESTIAANSRFFAPGEFQPTRAITMGVRGILQAKEIYLIATGGEKAEALHNAVVGPITPRCPASILQLHRNVTIFADDSALKLFTPEERRAFVSEDLF